MAHEGLGTLIVCRFAFAATGEHGHHTALAHVMQSLIVCLQQRVQVVLQGVRTLGSDHADKHERSPGAPNLHINTLLEINV
jgi:hypothetical protein